MERPAGAGPGDREVDMEGLKEQYGEIIRYLVVGVLTTVVSLAVYYGLVLTVLDPQKALELQCANVISWVAAVSFAYVANKLVVFRSRGGNVLREAASFFAARLGTLFLDMGIMFCAVTVGGMNDKAAKLIVQVVVTVANYILSKMFVFRGQKGKQAGDE